MRPALRTVSTLSEGALYLDSTSNGMACNFSARS